MPRKLCFVVRALAGGGIETVTLNLAEKLADSGVQVTIIILSPKKMEYVFPSDIDVVFIDDFLCNPIGIFSRVINKVVPLLGSYFFSGILSRRFEKIINNISKFDNIYLCGFGAYTTLFKVRLDNVVIQCHNTNSKLIRKNFKFFQPLTIKIFRYILKNKNITCVSDGIRNDLLNTLKVRPCSCETVYNLIDEGKLNRLSEKRVTLPTESFIVHVGRFVIEKNQQLLIRAYSKLDSGVRPKLIFLGEGPTLTECKELVSELGLDNSIEFKGFVSNPYPFIANAKFLVLCSDHEGLPTVLIEAQYLKTYCISSDCQSGPSEIIYNQSVGKLFSTGDEKDLLRALKEILNQIDNSPLDEITPVPMFSPSSILKFYQ